MTLRRPAGTLVAVERSRGERWIYVTLAGAMAVAVLVAPALAPATIEEQRARLPPPAYCQDPVEGIWQAAKYRPTWGEWTIFTLSVHRTAPGASTLTGSIQNHGYTGEPTVLPPPPCTPGRVNNVVAMTAVGTFAQGTIAFGGTRWWMAEQTCGAWSAYNLDHFSGTIDPTLQEFQSVNNDGGVDVNEPFVFRRIRCFDGDGPALTRIAVTPPALTPARHARGCSRN